MNTKRRPAWGRDWPTTTSDADRRYAVERAIARAKSARPWHERTLDDETEAAAASVHQRHTEEEVPTT